MKKRKTKYATSFLLLISLLLFSAENALADSLLQSGSLTYLGAFTVPSYTYSNCSNPNGNGACPQWTAYGGAAIGYNPSGNGGSGSLLMTGYNNAGPYVAEISIPASLYTGSPADFSDTTGLNQSKYVASFLQNTSPYFWDISQGHFTDIGSGGADESSACSNGWGTGGLYINGTTVYGTSYCYYTGGGAVSVLPIFKHTVNPLSGNSFAGNYGLNLSGGPTGDLNSGALGGIPSTYQSQLGGTMLAGANPWGMSIVTRTSEGPSVVAFDPGNFVANSISSAYPLALYPEDHQTLGVWGQDLNQYVSEADSHAAIVFPPNSRSVLVVGTHGLGGPGLVCSGLPTSGVNCYGDSTDDCSEACMVDGSEGMPTCTKSTCGGQTRGSENCCYDPPGIGNGHGNTSWPYNNYVWAFDVGDYSGNNSSGNNTTNLLGGAKNNLTAVKQGSINPWDIKPYAVWSLPSHYPDGTGVGGGGKYAGGTYDPVSSKLYISVYEGQAYPAALPVVEVFQVSTGSSFDTTPPAAPSGLSVY